MRLRLIISIASVMVMVFSTSLMAQFIPKAGISYANVSISQDQKDTYDPNIEYKLGFVGGVAYQHSFSDLISIQPELLFHQKGFRWTESGEESIYTFNYTETFTLNYIELPVMVIFKFGNFQVYGGPVFGYGIGGVGKWDLEYSDGQNTFSESGEGKVKFKEEPENYEGDDYYIDKPFEAGVAVGAGYKLFNLIIVDLRYGMGLTSIYSNEEDFDWTTKNNSFQFTIAYPIIK
jgi:hypothetical protein